MKKNENEQVPLFDTINAHLNMSNKLKEHIKALIATIPDNNRIERKSQNCFLMNSKDLMNNWSPSFHDFLSQVHHLIWIVDHTPIETMEPKLREICESGKWQSIKFHPDVIKGLKKIVGV